MPIQPLKEVLNETLLRREISIDGKSRAFINDTPVNLTILKQVGEQLIDIHSQHATQEINDSEFQLLIVDSLANHSSLLGSYRIAFKKLKQDNLLLKELIEKANEARSKQDYEQFLFNELEQAGLKEGEQEELEQELERLTHAESIKRGLLNASALLAENEISAASLLKEASLQLQSIEKFDAEIYVLYERLRSTIIELIDIADETSVIENKTLHSAERLSIIQQRLDLLYTLQQKHRVTNNSELLVVQQKLADSLTQLISSDEQIETLKKNIDLLKLELTKQANELSANRKKSIKVVETATCKTLHQVGMPNAKLVLNHQVISELNKDGLDEIQLLFSANAGQAPAPVNKVASGGELSRLMLAIKSLLTKHTSLPTLIFDEIDTGISGETALKVGKVIADLGNDMQILSITHLPQIASFATQIINVSKTTKIIEDQPRTVSIIEQAMGANRESYIKAMNPQI